MSAPATPLERGKYRVPLGEVEMEAGGRRFDAIPAGPDRLMKGQGISGEKLVVRFDGIVIKNYFVAKWRKFATG